MKLFVLLCLAYAAIADKRLTVADIFETGPYPVPNCLAKLHEAPCIQCCDAFYTGPLGFYQRPACHAVCKAELPAPPVSQKRQLEFGIYGPFGQLDIFRAKVAQCKAKSHEDPCVTCCDATFTEFITKSACHAACRALPAPPVKRGTDLWAVAQKMQQCEERLQSCAACCDAVFSEGLFAFAERATCRNGCPLP